MATVLLINPSYHTTYGSAKPTMTNPIYPTLELTTIAAESFRRGHRVRILDLSHRPYDWRLVRSKILTHRPDLGGVTVTTPLMNQLRDLSVLCKDLDYSARLMRSPARTRALATTMTRRVAGHSGTCKPSHCTRRRNQRAIYRRATPAPPLARVVPL